MEVPGVRRSGRPTREEAAILNQTIVEVALRSFLDEGFDATTIERVATQAGTTRRSVLHRYSSKDSLLTAAAEYYFVKLRAEVLGQLDADSADPMDALRRGCRLLYANVLKPDATAFNRLIMHQAYRIPELSERSISMSDELERGYARLILNAQAAGIFERHSARSLSRVVIGVFASNPLNRAVLGDPAFLRPDDADVYFSEAWSVFLAAA